MTDRVDTAVDAQAGVTDEPVTRSRTITWDDPSPVAEAAGRRSGLELLQGIMSGELPAAPIARTLNYDMLEVGKGVSVFGCDPDESLTNPIGVIHGGVAATLLDTATACAIHSELPVRTGYTTLSLTVDYLRGMTTDTGPVRCTGRTAKMGGRVAIADGELVGEDGTVYARGSSTCLIFRPDANQKAARFRGAPPTAAPRTRTVRWPDSQDLAATRAATTGQDFFHRMATGDLPQVPIYQVLGIHLAEVGDGRSVFTCDPGEHLYNPIGSVHGGVPATLIDSATGVALQSLLPVDRLILTVRLTVDYLRAITVEAGPLRCIGTVVRKGAQVAIADAQIVDSDDNLYARGSTTYMISKGKASKDG